MSQRIIQTLDLVLHGVRPKEIQSFFIPKYNLLSARDNEHKLRLFVVEEMLNQIKGLKMAHTQEDARETKRQIRVLEMVDILEYMFSSAINGKEPTALWNKMFSNIDKTTFLARTRLVGSGANSLTSILQNLMKTRIRD